MARIVSFDLGFSNSALRMPYALARLSCGHVAGVTTKPAILQCGDCRATFHDTPTEWANHQSCKGGAKYLHISDPHSAEDRVEQVGDAVACKGCEQEAHDAEWLEQLDIATVILSRYRDWCGQGSYYFYKHDPSSPSGKMLIGSVRACAAIEAILNRRRISPLSPTENLGAS